MISIITSDDIDLVEVERFLGWVGDDKGLYFQGRAIDPILSYLGESYIDTIKAISVAPTLRRPNRTQTNA